MKLFVSLGKHFFFIFLTLLCALVVVASFYRFVIRHDYNVEYEAVCNPAEQACFEGTDENTGDTYFYAKVHKYVPDVPAECGRSVSDCQAASICLPGDTDCSITYCSNTSKLDSEVCAEIVPNEPLDTAPKSVTDTEPVL